MKAFLGMGLLGSNFVKAMLQKGDTVQVWNRTATKAKALEQYGAKAFDNSYEAVQGADVIHVTLKDDAHAFNTASARLQSEELSNLLVMREHKHSPTISMEQFLT